jgi:hypothetical protein
MEWYSAGCKSPADSNGVGVPLQARTARCARGPAVPLAPKTNISRAAIRSERGSVGEPERQRRVKLDCKADYVERVASTTKVHGEVWGAGCAEKRARDQ